MQKEKEQTVNIPQEWEQVWTKLEAANEEFGRFLSGGLSVSDGRRVVNFTRRWDELKQQAEQFYDALDVMRNQQAEPVEVTLPWDTDTFRDAWQFWKDYLKEQYRYVMRSRMERKSLALLKKISDGSEEKAISYLDYAEATGYRKFFKVTERELQGAKPTDRRADDGDF